MWGNSTAYDTVSKGDVLSDLMIALFQAAHPICRGDTGELVMDFDGPSLRANERRDYETDRAVAKIKSCNVMMLA
jgi:hypothetical protein